MNSHPEHGQRLSSTMLLQYLDDGYCFPVSVLSDSEVVRYRALLEEFEHTQGGPLAGPYRHKMHLLLTWIDEVMRHPVILDVVEQILGPDILCWNTNFFIKEPKRRTISRGIRTRPIGV